MRKPRTLIILATLAFTGVLGGSANAYAQPIQWTAAAGGNGNWYQIVNTLDSWHGANTLASGMMWNGQTGYLASLTSMAENDFVQSILSDDCQYDNYGHPCYGYWIGAYQDRSAPEFSEPSGGWRWTTGETFSYSNWAPGEPNNTLTGRNDDWAVMYNQNSIWGEAAGKWNDDYLTGGFIVEYSGITTVPEPSSNLLMVVGFAFLMVFARGRRRKPSQF